MDELGWLDTAVFIHPLFTNDPLAPRCREILRCLQDGDATAWLDVIVVHELMYVLPRTGLPALSERQGVAEYIRRIVALSSVFADSKDELLETLVVWSRGKLAFADARLGVLGRQRNMNVCSSNEADFQTAANSFSSD